MGSPSATAGRVEKEKNTASSGGPLSPYLAEALKKRLLNVREDLARRACLRTTKSIATNSAVDEIVRQIPTTLAQLQALPFKELKGGKKVRI